MTAPTDEEFGKRQRHQEGEHAEEVDEDEGAAAFFAGQPWEAPDIAESDREADGRKEKAQPERPASMHRWC